MDLIVYCPGCAVALKGSRSEKRRDLTFLCSDCGIQIFFRGHRGLRRFLRVRQGQSVFYRWVVCNRCNVAVNQDRLVLHPGCPGCGRNLIHGLDGSETYSPEEIEKWKGGES